MQKKIEYIKWVIVVVIILALPMIVNAQPPSPVGDPDVPIDGGLSILLGTGVAYVVKKGHDRRKKSKE